MAGISAGRTLSDDGIDNFLILEGGDDIGGRVKSTEFGGVTIELGANWIQGLFSNGSTENNPLWSLKTKFNLEGNISNSFDQVVYKADGTRVPEELLNDIVSRFNATLDRYYGVLEKVGQWTARPEDSLSIAFCWLESTIWCRPVCGMVQN